MIRRLLRSLSGGRRKRKRRSSFRFNNEWTIYTLKGCPWCEKAKELLKNKGFSYNEIVCNDRKSEINEKFNGHVTYPKIVRNGKFIGGYSDLEKMFKRSVSK